MNIVVTGGAGFIGTHLVEKLVMRGDNVIVIDNLLTGSKENVSIFAKYVLSFAMILGRLEIFTLLIVMTPYFWKF